MALNAVVNGRDIPIDPSYQYSLGAMSTTDRDYDQRTLLIIDVRFLSRQCLSYSISTHKKDINVVSFASIADWQGRRAEFPVPDAILMSIGSRNLTIPAVATEIRSVCSEIDLPIILLADANEFSQIVNALECGVKGYIPSSVSLDVCVEAISLTMAGGMFVPVGSIPMMRTSIEKPSTCRLSDFFTDRQLEVVEALRRGKANKIIAFELDMQESTVKVHVRNIMKKVRASNRTEVAFKIMELMPPIF
ncbi:response regulator transcription factor [Rhizobium sp. Leaf262]|uniref:LuxR C-terminal-related transcriptional regulator n=1 Tax=Rhizobium sp. Leaf262 TaxID=1736312 RepID=UPI0007136862|nr:response regulator transcription factor [Rhizobium sp. Leaf262]KQO76286.1 LuxR family transcriptional regulator [Rhizobium sp. Leaf262]